MSERQKERRKKGNPCRDSSLSLEIPRFYNRYGLARRKPTIRKALWRISAMTEIENVVSFSISPRDCAADCGALPAAEGDSVWFIRSREAEPG